MKRSFIFFFLIIFLITEGYSQTIDVETEKAKVKTVIDQFDQVWETEDIDLFSRIIAHDADMVNIGTDLAEYLVGWEALKKAVEQMFPAFENIQITTRNQFIKVNSWRVDDRNK